MTARALIHHGGGSQSESHDGLGLGVGVGVGDSSVGVGLGEGAAVGWGEGVALGVAVGTGVGMGAGVPIGGTTSGAALGGGSALGLGLGLGIGVAHAAPLCTFPAAGVGAAPPPRISPSGLGDSKPTDAAGGCRISVPLAATPTIAAKKTAEVLAANRRTQAARSVRSRRPPTFSVDGIGAAEGSTNVSESFAAATSRQLGHAEA